MASSAKNWRWLVEWTWPSATYRYASFEDVTHDGHVWQNRIRKVAGLGGRYIDRKEAEFGDLVVTLCNLADDGSTNFPFHALNVVDDFEDKAFRVHLYDATTDEILWTWSGITKRPDFDPKEFTCTISATFAWDAIDIKLPAIPLGHLCPYAFGGSDYETAGGTVPSPGCPYATYGTPGFTACAKTPVDCDERGMLAFYGGWTHIAPVLHDDVNNLVERDKVRAGVVPLVYGTGDIKIKPEVYRAAIRDGELICNFIISGVHDGLPFDAAQIDASRLKLSGVTRASAVEFYTGVVDQAIPGSRTLFPEAMGHSFVAYGVARFPLTKEQIDKYSDNVPFHAIRARIDGGRKTIRSSGQTENPVYVLEDVLRDKIYGLGLPLAQIDSSAVISAASYVGGRFRGRFEIDRPEPLLDYVQRALGTWAGFITFNGDTMQIGAKRDDETAAAIFGTGGYAIVESNQVSCHEDDFADLVNDLAVRYRAKLRQKREFA
ncbi:MAG TPA: hypothetical protein PLV92_19780, partial [Pirellulaceae bacterium]|nr:hypothetical protein [Pirellulaceae bacterium]